MNRATALGAFADSTPWDIVIIGGGATGLGVALDAATRGYRTALVEARDFAHGTSSRSTKLIHGGVRYLRSGNIGLVRRALHERTLLRRNAPHLVNDLGFVIPAYAWHERLYYGTGLKLYDLLAGSAAVPSQVLDREEALRLTPTLVTQGLRGGVLYHDAQFDDARLALTLAATANRAGAMLANYVTALALHQSAGRITSVQIRDEESGREFALKARVVVNAAGVGCDSIRRLEDPSRRPILMPSQGAHIVLPARFLPGRHAVMIPKTPDGRVLFAIPWLGRVLVGTTDTPVSQIDAEPRPMAEEIAFLLEHVGRYLSPAPTRADVLSTFAGLRPLVRSSVSRSTSQLSRDHVIEVSPAGLVTITGGKWTTFREMAEDTVDRAAVVAGLAARPCRTATMALDATKPVAENTRERFHAQLPISARDVDRAVNDEMARSLDDVLSRRTRCLLLDAKATLDIAPQVAARMARELNWSPAREQAALEAFRALARSYQVP